MATETASASTLGAFRRGMAAIGYMEEREYRIERRYADGVPDNVPSAARNLMAMQPSLLVVTSTFLVVEARKLTKTVPILCPNLIDPVGFGLAESYARPGFNVTGMLNRVEGLTGKQAELICEAGPGIETLGYLLQVSSPNSGDDRNQIEAVARRLRLNVTGQFVNGPNDLEPAIRALRDAGAQGLVIPQGGVFLSERQRLVELISMAHLPTIYGMREQVDAGGLMSYGVNLNANWRRLAVFADKILKGMSPGDIPIEFATKIELIINTKAAKALDLAIPPSLFVQADEVIE